MAKVFVYSGLPGSGKTRLISIRHPDAVIFSTDDFFMEGGEYKYIPEKIGEAHEDCFKHYVECLRKLKWIYDSETWEPTRLADDHPDIIVDNTNTTAVEIAPYMLAAGAFGCEAEVVTVKCDPRIAFERNVHGVPEETHAILATQLDMRELMPWWKSSEIDNV
jgi:NEDD4-binding protein 2